MEVLSRINPTSGKEQYIKVKFTNDEIKALGTAVEVLPAPATNFRIAISPKSSAYLSSAGAYTTNTTLQFLYGSTVSVSISSLLNSATAKMFSVSPGSNVILEESALKINVASGNPGGGNAANYLIVEIYYDIVPSPAL